MLQYIVQPGDTLYFISLKFKTSVDTLMKINHISDAHMIYPGQMIKIPLPYAPGGETNSFPVMKKGSTGPFVILLQSQLARLGYYTGAMDSIFDNVTEGSLYQFQTSRGLPPTGFADTRTWKQLLDDCQSAINSPPYHAMMPYPGLFTILSIDKKDYQPGETIKMKLMKINLSQDAISLRYTTSQRYDFKISYPSGRVLWRWSEDKAFTQVLGSLVIAPGQAVQYDGEFTLSPSQTPGVYHVFGWNTARQTNHIKLHLTFSIVV